MIKNERGYALVLVLVVMLALFMLGTALIGVSTSQVKEAVKQQERVQAYYLAYSGANAVVEWVMSGEDVPEGESETVELDVGSFYVVVSENNNELTIVSRGTVDGYTEEVKVTLTKVTTETGQPGGSSHPAFDYALFSKNQLSTPHNVNIDASIYGQSVNLPSAGSTVSGVIISETFVRIHGNHNNPYIGGNICALDGNVDISYEGGLSTISGDVNASGDVSVGSSGNVNGAIFSGGNVELKPSDAKVFGNVHASNNITLGSGVLSDQSVYAGGNIELLSSNSEIKGDAHAGNNIKMGWNTNIEGSSYAGGSINDHDSESINCSVPPLIEPVSPTFCITHLIQTPDLSSFSHGQDNRVLLENWQESGPQDVLPGYYNNLVLNSNNTVRLSSGNYYFNNFNTSNPSGLKLQLDLSDGPINVYAAGTIMFSGQVWVSEDGDNWTQIHNLDTETAVRLAGMVYWETHSNFDLTSASGGPNNRQWFGTVLAKNNIITASAFRMIGAYATVEGAFSMDANPIIIYAPPTSSAAGGNGSNGSNGDNGNGNGMIEYSDPKWIRVEGN